MSNYATKPDLIGLTGIYTSKFAKEANLANLKSDIDELAINKLKTVPSTLDNLKSKICKLSKLNKLELNVPTDLKRLSDVVDKDVKKSEYSQLKSKVARLELKIPSTSTLIYNDQYNVNE